VRTGKSEIDILLQELTEALNKLAIEFELFARECEAQAQYLKRRV
jgi:hypothetical protein